VYCIRTDSTDIQKEKYTRKPENLFAKVALLCLGGILYHQIQINDTEL
jgi:hypothetical protein